MSNDAAELKVQMTDEVAALVSDYIKVAGGAALMKLLQGIAEARSEGRIIGVMKAAENFLTGA